MSRNFAWRDRSAQHSHSPSSATNCALNFGKEAGPLDQQTLTDSMDVSTSRKKAALLECSAESGPHALGKNLSHIAHLNGLRALAFVGVVLFHFKHGCQGGFLGVDVFFVLSGYLMTRSIAAQLVSNSFSYRTFLARRFWRLYPALLCTMVTTLAFTYGLFSSEHSIQVARSAIASFFGVSNVLFLSEEGYFGTSSSLKPLLHTWSLSIEWQFYLLWPLLMALSKKFSFQPVPPLPLACFCIASFLYGLNLASSNPAAAFFLLPGRAFEFGLGALAATSAPTISSSIVGNIMSAFGTCLISLSFIYLNATHGAPALIALPALFGALLIITSPSSVSCNQLYTSFFGDFLGRISYSAYLVHWPVYVFFNNIFEESPAPSYIEVVVLTAMMSVSTLMYHQVENEYRTGKRCMHKFVSVALVFTTLLASAWCLHAKGWNQRFSPKLGPNSAAMSQLGLRHEFDSKYDPHAEALRKGSEEFEFGYIPISTESRIDMGHPFTAAIVGDSFAAPLAGLFDELAAEGQEQFVLTSRHSCTPFLDATSMDSNILDFENPTNNPRVVECKQHIRRQMLDLIQTTNTDTVLLIGNWLNTLQMKRAMEASVSAVLRPGKPDVQRLSPWKRTVSQLELTIMKIIGLQKKVILVGMIPGAHYDVRACYAAKGPLTFLKRCPIESSFAHHAGIKTKMSYRLLIRRTLGLLMRESPSLRKAQQEGNLVYVDPYLSLCKSTKRSCLIASKREPYYYDEGHLTMNGSLLLKHDIGQALWLLKHHNTTS